MLLLGVGLKLKTKTNSMEKEICHRCEETYKEGTECITHECGGNICEYCCDCGNYSPQILN